jgi:hypothetical protein
MIRPLSVEDGVPPPSGRLMEILAIVPETGISQETFHRNSGFRSRKIIAII